MADSRGTNDTSNQSNCYEPYSDYMKRAAGACAAGDLVLGMHLYLAAYERAVADPDIPDGMALAGLREAWSLACDLKERSMAEYVFEKLEPFLTGEEIAECANKLQSLALDRLEEYGFSREELQDMAEMISQDLMGGEGSIVKVESISIPGVEAGLVVEVPNGSDAAGAPGSRKAAGLAAVAGLQDASSPENDNALVSGAQVASASADAHGGPVPTAKGEGKPEKVGLDAASADFNPYDWYNTSSVGKSYHAATNEGTDSYVFTRDKDRAAELERTCAEVAEDEAGCPGHDVSDAGQTAMGEMPCEGDASSGGPASASATPLASGVSGQDNSDGQSSGAAPSQGSANQDEQMVPASASAQDEAVEAQTGAGAGGAQIAQRADKAGRGVAASGGSAKPEGLAMPSMPDVPAPGAPVFNYRSLVGYGDAIASVRELGVGLERDGGFRNFIQMMNARHGLDRMPALDTLLFRAPVIEDATRFVDATIGEIGLPVLRMSMEEGFQGAPMLCVTTFGDSRPRMNHAHNRFDGPAILVLDDLDTWVMPQSPENVEGIAGFVMANMSRGAREAINMIRSAVEDPDVYVLATSSDASEVDPFFYEILEPISIIDIANPNEDERDEIWREILHDHPSMRTIDRATLVRFSAGMPRYDVYMAARAAIEEAYKEGLVQRMYLPVTLQNILDKLASCQPLDSDEYRAIEDEVVRGFRDELDNLEKLLDGDETA